MNTNQGAATWYMCRRCFLIVAGGVLSVSISCAIFGVLNWWQLASSVAGALVGLLLLLFVFMLCVAIVRKFGVWWRGESYGSNAIPSVSSGNLADNIIEFNVGWLRSYRVLSLAQYNRAFALAIVSLIATMAVLSGAVKLAFMGEKQSALIAAIVGVVGWVSSLILIYINNRTVLEAGRAAQRFTISNNIGLAMKMVDGLPQAEKIVMQKELISCLIREFSKASVDSLRRGTPARQARTRAVDSGKDKSDDEG